MAIHAKNTPNKTAVVFEGRQISWQELWHQVENASYFFVERLGVEHQQVVGLLMTNSIEFVIIYLAILQAGHIAAPIDPVYKKLEIDAIAKQLEPALMIMQTRYIDQISNQSDQKIVDATVILNNRYKLTDVLRLSSQSQIASLTFTSGTTAKPKIVPNTHSNHIWNIIACSKVWDWTEHDTLLINLPLSHMHGLVIGLSGIIYHGNTLYLHQQAFDTKTILKELSSGKISFFTHSPLAYMKIMEQPGDYDLSKVRLFISGSAPLPPKTWQDFKDRFGIEIIETYGTSETGRIAGNGLDKKMIGSPGQILPGVDMKLGEDNEVQIKSDGVFPGYWHNPIATRVATTKDGYWRTGDVGELKDGYLFLKSRISEKIRRFGYTVSPRDVEWALLDNPNVKEAFVLGKQIPGQPNDQIYYFISSHSTEADIMKYCKQNLPFNWRPDKIIFVDRLPRTRNGKPDLVILKQTAQAAANA